MTAFVFRLALSMGKSVVDLLKSMSSRELTAWMAYYSCEPWGSDIEGTRHAVTASTVANVGLGASNPSKLKRDPFKLKDFLVGGTKLSSPSVKKEMKAWDWKEHRDKTIRALGLGVKKNGRG